MDEVGANIGFIISANGFQSGAEQAAQSTNIHLVTWDEFQARFLDRWFEAMRLKLAAVADEVFEYSDYFLFATQESQETDHWPTHVRLWCGNDFSG